MENATDALKMAAAVLIFVLALSITINAFGQARKAATAVLEYNDREYDYTYVEDNGTTQRIVNAETIIPAIYKAYKENFKIIFKFKDSNEYLYEKYSANGEGNRKKVYSIDLEKDVIGDEEEKERFIRIFLYGTQSNNIDERIRLEEQRVKLENSGIYLNTVGFYDKIIGKKFKESLGVYYQEEIQGETDTPEVNRNKKRVITYEEID